MSVAAKLIDRRVHEGSTAVLMHHYYRPIAEADRSNDPGIMVAFKIPQELARKLKLQGGEDASVMHVTVAYFGRKSEHGEEGLARIEDTVRFIASATPVIDGRVGGLGRFVASDSSDGKDVLVSLIDAPGLGLLRAEIVKACKTANIPMRLGHDFTPHMTMAYVDTDAPTPEFIPDAMRDGTFKLDKLYLCVNNEVRAEMPLMGYEDKK